MGNVKHFIRVFFFYLFLYGHCIFCMENTDITKLSLELEQQLIDCKPTSQYLNFVFAHILDSQDSRNQTNERCHFKFILNYAKKHWYCPETTLILLLVGQRLSLYNGLDINIWEKIAFFVTAETCWNYFHLHNAFPIGQSEYKAHSFKIKNITFTFSGKDNENVNIKVQNDMSFSTLIEMHTHATGLIQAIENLHTKYKPLWGIPIKYISTSHNLYWYFLQINKAVIGESYMHPLCLENTLKSLQLRVSKEQVLFVGMVLKSDNDSSFKQNITIKNMVNQGKISPSLTMLYFCNTDRFLLFKTMSPKHYSQLTLEEKEKIKEDDLALKIFKNSEECNNILNQYVKQRKVLFLLAPTQIGCIIFTLLVILYGIRNGVEKIIINRPFFNVVDASLYGVTLFLNSGINFFKYYISTQNKKIKQNYYELYDEFKEIKNKFAWSRH